MRYQIYSPTSYYKTIEPGKWGRGTNDGVNHPSHLYAIRKYVQPRWSLLDVGCGSGTTYEAIKNAKLDILYKGIDNDKDYIDWCFKTFPETSWDVQDGTSLKENDQSWDVVFSRGTIENLPSFELCMREWTRVARKFIIIWFWKGLREGDHSVQRFIYNNTLYPEFANTYGVEGIKTDMKKFPDWKIVELNTTTLPGVPFGFHCLVVGKICLFK